jgi:V8-like Glu-specific endopeptidase
MPDQPEDLLVQLRLAAQDYERGSGDAKMGDGVNPGRVEALTVDLIAGFRMAPATFREEHVVTAARILRRRRLFGTLERLVEAWLRNGGQSRLLRTLYAQALVDQDQLMAALDVLLPLLAEPPYDDKAAEEARGLLGRVHKQAFVRAGNPLPWHGAEALRLAVAAYADAYARARRGLWPGINLVALLARAQADRVEVPVQFDPKVMARTILEAAEAVLEDDRRRAIDEDRTPEDEPWAVATALEAAIALEEDDLAVKWGRRYLACEKADAFELASTHRQLTEIWRLHERKGRKAAALVPLLEGELLKKKRGSILKGAVGMRSVEVSGAELEAVWGTERFQTWQWMKRAVRSSDAVGQVQDVNGSALGSGFLVLGRDLCPAWGDEILFLTNRHVVDAPPDGEAPEPGRRPGLPPARARVQLTALSGAEPIPVKAVVWRSAGADARLDTVVLRLAAPPPNATPLDLGDPAGLKAGGEEPSRIFVIGHPKGAALSYSLYGNELRAIEPPLLYYRSPTEEGSSGSPVFNPDFFLVGIHHSAVPEREANCGTLIDAVRKAIAGG